MRTIKSHLVSNHVVVSFHWHKEQTMQIKWDKHLSEPFHVTNGFRKGEY